MRQGEAVFVDTGAWIALALSRDPLHEQARERWALIIKGGLRIHTSVPVVIETFTFLERNAARDVALTWKDSIATIKRFKVLICELIDLEASWDYFKRREYHKLSAVDATSFAVMRRARIGLAFAFDYHFATAGFRMVG